MKNVVQPAGGGPVTVLDVPRPIAGPTEVLVRTLASVISPGTEAGGRLPADLPLGCSAAGEVVEVGASVSGVARGQLVATGAAEKAGHAEFQAVPGLLCAAVPGGVAAADAAFATVAAVGLHSLRLAEAGPGSKVAVIGLGLIGQLAARVAIAAGCDVAGIDPAGHARAAAARAGVLTLDELGDATTGQILEWSRGRGADAVLICAATPSSGPVRRAPALCRDRAAVVIVGDVGLMLDRTPFYQRELSLRFCRSYGPGRFDPSQQAWGVDYPPGQVRWSEGRNLEAVLDLLAAGRLAVSDLVTHTFDIADAPRAYEMIDRQADPYLAIRLTYPATAPADEPVLIRRRGASAGSADSPGVGWIGAGSFSARTLLPTFRRAGFGRLVAVASASGVTARQAAERHGFGKAVSGAFPVIDDPDVAVVVVATRHDTHAELATLALKDGRHVWCEKPLALTMDELEDVRAAWEASGQQLMIGFNRRWSPAVCAARRALADVTSPKYLVYRVAAGPVPEGHWYADRRQGGRLIGEVCHFVDTAQALVGADIAETVSVLGAGAANTGAANTGAAHTGAANTGAARTRAASGCQDQGDAIVSLRFTDGSLATICYGSSRTARKEWIEVTAGSRRLVINDFRWARLDGRTLWYGRRDKGHRASAAAFFRAVSGGLPVPTAAMLATTRATLLAAEAPRG